MLEINKTHNLVGWLVWWTIPTAECHSLDKLNALANQLDCPYQMKSLKAREGKSAWVHATQIGSRGVTSRKLDSDDPDGMSRYYVRDADKEFGIRILIRETVSATQEIVDTETCASLYHTGTGFTYLIQPAIEMDKGKLEEVQGLIDQMLISYKRAIGTVDDNRVRGALTSWLESVSRVTVRGSGGVYFIPRTSKADLEQQIVSVRNWIKQGVGGSFSIMEMTPNGITSFEDVLETGYKEVKDELEDVNNRLTKWANNDSMNHGSRAISVEMLQVTIGSLKRKVAALAEAFDTESLVIEDMLQVVQKRADDLKTDSLSKIKNKVR